MFAKFSLSEIKAHLRDSLYRNSFFLLLNRALGAGLGFAFWIVAARFYSPVEVGIISALIAAMMLLASFSRLGFDMGIVRFLSAAKDKSGIINSCLTITCLASLAAAIIFVAGLDFWSQALSFIRQDWQFLACFITFTIIFALSITLSSVFVAFRRAEFAFFQSTIGASLRAGLPILLVSAGAIGLFFSWGIGICVAIATSLLLFLPRLQPKYRPRLKIKKSVISSMMHFSAMNYIVGLLQGAPQYVLPLLVINMLGLEVTAYFRIAWAISSILFLTIPVAVATSLFAEGSHNPAELRGNAIRAIKLMLALITPGIIILFFLGDKILLLFGVAYSENGLRLMQILALSAIPSIFINIYIIIRTVQMRMKEVIGVVALMAALVLGLIYAFIPRFGSIGIGYGWVLGHVIVAGFIGAKYLINRRGRSRDTSVML